MLADAVAIIGTMVCHSFFYYRFRACHADPSPGVRVGSCVRVCRFIPPLLLEEDIDVGTCTFIFSVRLIGRFIELVAVQVGEGACKFNFLTLQLFILAVCTKPTHIPLEIRQYGRPLWSSTQGASRT